MAGGRYGRLRDEVPRGDLEWDVGEGEDLELDLEEFDISPPRGVRREAAERSRRRRDEEAYMEGVRREHLGSAYMEEPPHSHRDCTEEMDVAAVGVRGRGQWEPRSTSRPAFMVSKAADAAVWEDLKDIKPPMYDGNPLNLDRFLEKLDDWGLTVTEDMAPADAEKYVFRRFRYRLPDVLQELYFVATKEGKIKTLKEAKKWLNEKERVDGPQVAAKRWKSIKLQHDGREIRLRDWRDFRGQYTLFRRNVEDWNEGDEQVRLLSMLPETWIKSFTKEEAKRAKSNHTVKMMLPKEYHSNVVAWARRNLARDVKRHSLRNALLITVSGDREKTAMWRLDECDVSSQTIRLQAIPARMSCDEILEWVGDEVLKEYRNLHHTRGLKPGDRDVNYVGEGPGGEAAMDPAGADGDETLVDDDDDNEPAEVAVCAFVANNLSAGSKPETGSPCSRVGGRRRRGTLAALATLRCPLGSSYELTLRAVSCVMGGRKASTMTTEHAPPTRPTRRPTRRRTGRRSVHLRVSGRPKWRWTRMSSPSWCRRGPSWPRRSRRSRGTGSPGRTTRTRRTTRTTRTRTRTRRLKGEGRRASTRLVPRRLPLLPQPTPPSGAPAAKGPS